MNQAIIDQVEKFARDAFASNPSYSFGDGHIMTDHGVRVKDLAWRIAASVECDRELLAVMALLHDIGKTCAADAQTLHERHDELGFEAAKDLLPQLPLTPVQAGKLGNFLRGDMGSIEAEIVKDADAMAFFGDERLQRAFKEWADGQGLPNELQRKADKFAKLKFQISREIGRPLYEDMIKRWELS